MLASAVKLPDEKPNMPTRRVNRGPAIPSQEHVVNGPADVAWSVHDIEAAALVGIAVARVNDSYNDETGVGQRNGRVETTEGTRRRFHAI